MDPPTASNSKAVEARAYVRSANTLSLAMDSQHPSSFSQFTWGVVALRGGIDHLATNLRALRHAELNRMYLRNPRYVEYRSRNSAPMVPWFPWFPFSALDITHQSLKYSTFGGSLPSILQGIPSFQ